MATPSSDSSDSNSKDFEDFISRTRDIENSKDHEDSGDDDSAKTPDGKIMDPDDESAFEECVKEGYFGRLKQLLKKGNLEIDKPMFCCEPYYTDCTALMKAAEDGDERTLEVLLDAGAGVNTQGGSGCTALLTAAYKGQTKCIKLLLQKGAEVNLAAQDGYLPIMFASQEGHSYCLDILINAGAKVNTIAHGDHLETAILLAAGGGHKECVKLLIGAGADVNSVCLEDEAPILGAAECGSLECIHELLQAGADVDFQREENNYGRTALILCSSGDHIDCIKCLLMAGADVNLIDNDDSTVLHYAVSRHLNTFKLLIYAGANIHSVDGRDRSLKMLLKSNDNRQLYVFLKNHIKQLNSSLKNISRTVIRQHLMETNPETNLFCTVPHLGLPSIMTSYLLYESDLYDGRVCTSHHKNYKWICDDNTDSQEANLKHSTSETSDPLRRNSSSSSSSSSFDENAYHKLSSHSDTDD